MTEAEFKVGASARNRLKCQTFNVVLEQKWLEHFEPTRAEVPDTVQSTFAEGGFMSYSNQIIKIGLALEHLRKANIIDDRTGLFDGQQQMRAHLPAADLVEALFNKKILKGVRVGVIGGPEARIFADMGAEEALSIDPRLSEATPVAISGLTEIPDNLGEAIAARYTDFFDMTYSSRLIDQGSGLEDPGNVTYQKKIQVYQYYLRLIAQMTKRGGISIHDGNMMVHAIRGNQDCFSVQDISPYVSGDYLNTGHGGCDSLMTFVLKRK